MNTGKRRYREQKRFLRPSLLVLQVEYRDREYDPWGGFAVNRWRDATVEDLMTIPAAVGHDFPLSSSRR
ncbi:hypothetical protein [Mesorhizobium sp.]|uniref:hypothetical protein n=1 Tax=Mesorhizobium sp. TaxID=1871066 RepID=UPI000FEA24D4|nr:hypothetical protein [Mesorhizobium sp.]RWI35504.1 MAG: hypothetical protein EOR14_28795 [Mesorhizobium sp.]RWJ66327.1 MAG: hypothetical protein EOR34_28340 [Mesorhizobium sp.]